MSLSRPRVSIGLPVYNGELTLRSALDSLTGQTFTDIEIIISDNASTDSTETICREYQAHDSRIRYIRQSYNIGPVANFELVLRSAQAPYFMWAAADDQRSEGYLEANFNFLTSNSDYVASTSPTRFQGGEFDPVAMGDRSLGDQDRYRRICEFFGPWHANGSFYSLMRTGVIRKCPFVGVSFFASDWAIVLYLAKAGKLKRIESEWVELGRGGMSNNRSIFKHFRTSFLDYLLPFRTFTIVALRLCSGGSLATRWLIFHSCMLMNARAFRALHMGNVYYLYKKIRGHLPGR